MSASDPLLQLETLERKRHHFWKQRLSQPPPHPEPWLQRVAGQRPFPQWAEELLPDPRKSSLRILDVQAGPASGFGIRHPTRHIQLVPIDSLAEAYADLWHTTDLPLPPVPTISADWETLNLRFGPENFDLAHAHALFENVPNPLKTIRQILRLLTPGASLVVFEEDYLSLSDPQRTIWRTSPRTGRLQFRHLYFWIDAHNHLPQAHSITHNSEGKLQRFTFTKQSNAQATASLPIPRLQLPTEPGQALISLHIPKTAGTSFSEVLNTLFPNNLHYAYQHETSTRHFPDSFAPPPHTRCVHGHFQIDAFDRFFTQRTWITWLRHPVERLVSSYYQILRNPADTEADPFLRRVHREKLSLLQFARLGTVHSETLWYLKGLPIELFAFIGLTEKFDQSMQLFAQTFSLDLQNLQPQTAPANTNPNKNSHRYPLPQGIRKAIQNILEEEIALYDKASQLFHARLQSIQP